MRASRKYPLEFRKEEVSHVMQRWRAGDSCALVGVGSVGKSNLLQHLADADVQTHYMKLSSPDQFRAIIIDPNMLGPLPDAGADRDQIRCWAGYELLMHRLYTMFHPFEMLGRDEAKAFFETYRLLQDGTNPLYAYMALRYLEEGLDYFFERGIRIVFMFDEFEEFLKQLPIKFFHTLRGLRDANKSNLSYLTFTRKPLETLTEEFNIDPLALEPFTELFTDNTYFVGPYNDADAHWMVYNLMERNQRTYHDSVINLLLQATGRYAGLLRAGFRILDNLTLTDSATMPVEAFATQLAPRRTIRSECITIWNSLSESERHMLRAVASLTQIESNAHLEQAVSALVQKRLLRIDRTSERLTIEPPVFRIFVANDPTQEV